MVSVFSIATLFHRKVDVSSESRFMRALIFGCGYLGQRVASAWISAGYDVFAVTRSDTKAEWLRSTGIQPIVADLCDRQTLINLPNVDVVLHAVGFDRSPVRTHEEVTCGGIRNILDAITDRSPRLIHVSSTSVYGQSSGEWVDETSECQPTQAGGQLCVQAENLIRQWVSSNPSVSATILRLAGIYGPGRLLSRTEALKSGMPIAGRGDSFLNLIHVDDAASAVVICERSQAMNETYLVVDDQPIPRSIYFGKLASLVGAPVPTFDSDQLRTRGSGGLNKRCSNRKLRNALNWVPIHATIETGLPASMERSE